MLTVYYLGVSDATLELGSRADLDAYAERIRPGEPRK
jgi:hypothetical protein